MLVQGLAPCRPWLPGIGSSEGETPDGDGDVLFHRDVSLSREQGIPDLRLGAHQATATGWARLSGCDCMSVGREDTLTM